MEFLASYDFDIAYTPLFVERKSLEFIATFDFTPVVKSLTITLASLELRTTLLDQVVTS